jgi:catechol-2,3-dioxygenase
VPITRMNHAVLYVRDAGRTAEFYESVLGFLPVTVDPARRFAFLRAPGSSNHHDIAFFTIGADASPSPAGRGAVGLYHIAWEVPTLDELDEVRDRLTEAGALVGASDHGTSKSIYARDPDGLEFEVMWLTPPERWEDDEAQPVIRPLDIEAAKRLYGATTVSKS